MKHWQYKLLDKFHLTLFWYTERVRKQLTNETDTEKKYMILSRFLKKVARKMSITNFGGCFRGTFNINDLEYKTWNDVYNALDYCSDRWSLSRVLRFQAFVDYHKWMKFDEREEWEQEREE